MRTIWKYEIRPECTFNMPLDSKVLSVHEQSGGICLWAEVDPDRLKAPREFRVYGTGHNLPEHDNLFFLGTVPVRGGSLVFHVYEKIS